MFRAIKEYKLAVGTSPSAAFEIPVPTDSGLVERGDIQYRLRAKDCDVVFKFGDSSVSASNSVASNARPDENFSLGDGAIEMFKSKNGQSYVSVVSEDGTSTGYLILTVGVGDT